MPTNSGLFYKRETVCLKIESRGSNCWRKMTLVNGLVTNRSYEPKKCLRKCEHFSRCNFQRKPISQAHPFKEMNQRCVFKPVIVNICSKLKGWNEPRRKRQKNQNKVAFSSRNKRRNFATCLVTSKIDLPG